MENPQVMPAQVVAAMASFTTSQIEEWAAYGKLVGNG
jgi:hypothetical protein